MYELSVMLESHNYIQISAKSLFLVCTKEMNWPTWFKWELIKVLVVLISNIPWNTDFI